MSKSFYVRFKKVAHYWKWVPWTQPVFSGSNIASDGSVISSDSIRSTSTDYGAMDGIKSGTDALTTWEANNNTNCYWRVVFPYKIKITGITHYNAGHRDNKYREIKGRFYADTGMTQPIGDAISTPETSWYATQVSNIPSEGIITDTVYFRKTGGNAYAGIGELEITATKLVTGSDEDYDFVEYAFEPSVIMKRIPNYFKWEAWTQPVLSNDTSFGTVTVSYAYSGYPGYKALDNTIGVDTSRWITGDKRNTGWWKWVLPYPIRISKIEFYNSYSSVGNITKDARFYADSAKTIPLTPAFVALNEGWGLSSFDVDNIITDTIYLDCLSSWGTYVGMGELKITATVLESGTAEDYDFIEWDVACYALVN